MQEVIKAWWWRTENNLGDVITPPIIEYLTGKLPEYTDRNLCGKLIAVGSIIHVAKEGDTVWGSGWKGDHIKSEITGVEILSVRGPLTRDAVLQARGKCPESYGDPALLLPIVYQPENQEKKYDVGYIPHYIDVPFFQEPSDNENAVVIDVTWDWKRIVDVMVRCKKIVSSSLHGIIVAEAYGIQAEWAVYGDRLIGGELKFQDYFLGTGRDRQEPFGFITPMTIKERYNLREKIMRVFYDWYELEN